MNQRLQQLSDAGVSIWLDDLSRERLETGNLADLIKNSNVVGVTTNPSIFQGALADGERYDDQVRQLAAGHGEVTDQLVDDTVFTLTTTDVANACDLFTPVFEATNGVDGRVSIEVAPGLAHDTEGTVAQARALWGMVDRPNAYIKIPATAEGVPAIAAALAEGININVTLIFGLGRYREVMEAYVSGLEQARRNGHDLSRIHSVASFFVSRVDTEIDNRLAGVDGGAELQGKAGVANARLAYAAFEEFFTGDRWQALADAGARLQRPLWASTGVKNPAYRDTMYVYDLTVANTVNTMPEKTLEAVADHGEHKGDQVHGTYDDSRAVLDAVAAKGISYDDVVNKLEAEGVEKFIKAWDEVLETVRGQLEKALAGSDVPQDAQ